MRYGLKDILYVLSRAALLIIAGILIGMEIAK